MSFMRRSDPALASAVATLERDIREILESGRYYCTPEVASQLSSINNALHHLRLDSNFLTTSTAWNNKFDPSLTTGVSAGATEILLKCGGFMYDYKDKMALHRIQDKQENEIRSLHEWAMQNLFAFQNELDKYSHVASDRIRQFGDHVGVTDRFTGYRNNLSRGSRDPFRLQTSWMDKSSQLGFMTGLATGSRPSTAVNYRHPMESYYAPARAKSAALGTRVRFAEQGPVQTDTRGYQTIDTLYPRSNPVYGDKPAFSQKLDELKQQNAYNAHITATLKNVNPSLNMSSSGLKNLSVQEQAGINTTFPGRTEYMQKYGVPEMDIKTSDFNINPTPNFLLHKRPLGKTTFEPSNTEYQVRYEFPDSEKIVKMPWLRK